MLRSVLRARILLRVLLGLILLVVALNWTYGRLPATPRPTGSFLAAAPAVCESTIWKGPAPNPRCC